VGGIGFKPSPQAAEAYLRRQGGPDYGLAVPKSTKSAYSYHEAAAEGDATWNDGLLLEPEVEGKMLARAKRKAEVALEQSKEVASGPTTPSERRRTAGGCWGSRVSCWGSWAAAPLRWGP
jgi:hypothetical protein